MNKQQRRLKRAQQRDQEVAEALEDLEYVESCGFGVDVDENGIFGATVDLGVPQPLTPKQVHNRVEVVRDVCDSLYEMHRSERQRSILLDAWELFQLEEEV
jgi:hypothetical protein